MERDGVAAAIGCIQSTQSEARGLDEDSQTWSLHVSPGGVWDMEGTWSEESVRSPCWRECSEMISYSQSMLHICRSRWYVVPTHWNQTRISKTKEDSNGMSNGSVQGLSPTTLEYQSNCPDAQVVFPAQEKSTKSERTRATAARPRDQGILAAEKKGETSSSRTKLVGRWV